MDTKKMNFCILLPHITQSFNSIKERVGLKLLFKMSRPIVQTNLKSRSQYVIICTLALSFTLRGFLPLKRGI